MKNRYLIWLNWPERPFRLEPEDEAYFRSVIGEDHDVVSVRDEDAFVAALPAATHAICWEFRKEWFAIAPHLRVLATPGAGRELVPSDRELPNGVTKFHGEFHGAIMSETVIAYMLAWRRGLYPAYRWQCSGETSDLWRRSELGDLCFTLAGSKAVILGFGRIGRAIGRKLDALGARVCGIRRSNVGTLAHEVAGADWLICALPSDTGTDNIVDAALIGGMKRSAVLINVGRGNAVDELALAEALSERRIAAAFLDVFRREPLTMESPLAADLPGLFRFPHASAFSPDYLARFFDELGSKGALR